MPRSNRPRRRGRAVPPRPVELVDLERARAGAARRESSPDGEWFVRPVAGTGSGKPYRCPGCDQEIRPGVPHLVVWPADDLLGPTSAVGDRRHWHRPCWTARGRRGRRA